MTPVRAGEPAMTVYVVDGLTRVRPDEAPRSATAVEIQAARNEYEPFQVVVHAGEEGLQGVDVSVSELCGKEGGVIPSRWITLYREHYVQVTQPSPRSKEGAGWYPDALIPFANPIDGKPVEGARFGGAPFDVPPHRNQPVWVDVFVPDTAAPGSYSGTVTVLARGQPTTELPVKLTVWDFTLPANPSLRSNFGSFGRRVAAAHGVAANTPELIPIERRYAEAMAVHRLSPLIPNDLRPRVNPDGSIDPSQTHAALKEWMDQLHVTGFPIGLLGGDPTGADRARNIRHLQATYAYLKENGWEKYAYVYVLDEPNDAAAYEQVRQRAQLVHEAEPSLKVLCTEQPTPQDPAWGTLIGSVDIWVPLWPLWDEKAGAERLAAGQEVWSYTALCQGEKEKETPHWELDFPLLNYRIPAWLSWRCGMTGLLYWSTVCWDKAGDVWTNPRTYHEFNGEGALFYPGTAAGFAGPVASMRLKQIREGLEDYEYLRLLADGSGRPLADAYAALQAWGWTNWDTDPAHLYTARMQIAELIETDQSFGSTSSSFRPR
jgi:hypothetical protein